MNPLALFTTAAVAFSLGAIPFSWIIGRILQGVDIRSTGSGNVGATNLARAIGFGPGVAALLLDAAKGVAAVLFARWMAGTGQEVSWLPALTGALAVIGHNFTPFLRFKGGKGVATGAGVFGALAPLALVTAVVVFLSIVLTSRLVSLGSVAAAAALPLAVLLIYDSTPVTVAAFGVAALVVLRHRGNLLRIRRGTEDRITDTDKRTGSA
ncbi:MAG: glycerol-3-phosphate 1-O-acyltransferase PlsY [Acidobacteriota bacterium]